MNTPRRNTYRDPVKNEPASSAYLLEKLRTDAYIDDNGKTAVFRWKSNDRTVPSDFVYFAYLAFGDTVAEAVFIGQAVIEQEELAQVIAAYREAKTDFSDEEKFEIDANFPAGEKVVDVISGAAYVAGSRS